MHYVYVIRDLETGALFVDAAAETSLDEDDRIRVSRPGRYSVEFYSSFRSAPAARRLARALTGSSGRARTRALVE